MRVAQFETSNKNLSTLINEWLIDNEGVYVVDIKYNTIPNQYGLTYSALLMYLPVDSDRDGNGEGVNPDQITLDDVLKHIENDVNSNSGSKSITAEDVLRSMEKEINNDR